MECVFSLAPQLLYLWCLVSRRLGGPESQSACLGGSVGHKKSERDVLTEEKLDSH
jgi:hypothetical protein